MAKIKESAEPKQITSGNTGIAALDAIIKTTSKQFGKDLGNNNFGNVEGLPTGSATLDFNLGIGGIPKDHVTEIFGWQSSGKTSLALTIIALRQKARAKLGLERKDLIIDLEYSLTENFVTGFGIDLSQVVWVRPETAEEALTIAIEYPKSGAIDTVLFDSVDAAQNTKMLTREIGQADVGGISKDMNNAMRQISKICAKHQCTYIFINQIKQNPGVMYGSPNVTTGGNALKFYAMMRLELMQHQPSKKLPGAMNMRIKLNKTKVAPPKTDGEIELEFLFGKGFDRKHDLISFAKDRGAMRSAGPTVKITWANSNVEETLCKGGIAELYKLLDDEVLFEKVKAAALASNPNDVAVELESADE